MSDYIFEIRNLSGENEEGYTLSGLDLYLKPAEVHALVGERGMGKKAFVQLLTGTAKTKAGKIIFNGNDITSRIAVNSIDGLAFLIKKSQLIDNLTVAENLFVLNYPRKKYLSSINWKEIQRSTEELFNELGITIDFRKKIYELSNEEQKLVSIIKIYLQGSQVVILHEPTDNLGAKSILKLFEIIKKMKGKGSSFIYVTNEWEEALKISDRISVLSRGSIVGTLDTNEAKKNPRRLLNMISGWQPYSNTEKDMDEESNEVLNVIFKAAEFLTSNYELEDVLKFLTKHVSKVMNSASCTIYLIDEETNSIIDCVEYKASEETEARLTREAIIQMIKKDDLYYTTENDGEFKSYFKMLNGIKTIICVPVLIRSHITGLIQISYRDFYVHSEKDIIYLSTFARQVAIAIEDTRLMGSSALLQESHHRIKNNLQTIISLIKLQKRFIKKDPTKSLDDVINDIISRIKSIAAVHDLLSREKLGRSIINFKEIIMMIIKFYSNDSKVDIRVQLDDIIIPYNKATAIALIINELINNCYKHAFANQDYGIIEVSCNNVEEKIILTVEDNGRGLPGNFDINNLHSLGLSIVNSIIKNEFNGKIGILSKPDKGTKIKLTLPQDKISLTRW